MAEPREVDGADDGDGQDEGNPPRKNWRRELEARAEAAEKRAAELERKVALSDAGLSELSEKQVKALLSAHDGDISGEALAATATELGFGSAPAAPDPEVQEHAEELGHLTRFSGAPANSSLSPAQQAEAIRQEAANFKGTPQQYNDFLYRNAELLAP